MEKHIVRQTVNLNNLDSICSRYEMCGWKEIDIIGTPNHPEDVVFEWIGSGLPKYPDLSFL